MKLRDFKKRMKKKIFSTAEAHLLAFTENPKLINLQLHQWKEQGELISLKRGLYAFANADVDVVEIAKNLYSPCYFSLEYILSLHGILPEAVFSYTLVTTKAGRRFETALGTFIYQKIKKEAFTGYDENDLKADKEKALADYFYLNKSRFKPGEEHWEESRLDGSSLNFKKLIRYAKLFGSPGLMIVINNFIARTGSHSAQ